MVFLALLLVLHVSEHDRTKRGRLLGLCISLVLFSLVIDSMAYIFMDDSTPFLFRYVVSFLAYSFGGINAIAFAHYSEAYFEERTKLNPWLFRILKISAIVLFVITSIAYFEGRILVYENGIEVADNGFPISILLFQIAVMLYTPIVSIIYRKQIGLEAVVLLSVFNISPMLGLCMSLLTSNDYSYVFGSIILVLVDEFLQRKQSNSRKMELEQERVLRKESEIEHKDEIIEQKAKLEESLTFTNYFLDTYIAAYYVDLESMNFKVIKDPMTQQGKNYIAESPNLKDPMKYFSRIVNPDDKGELESILKPERVRELLRQGDYSFSFREVSSGTERFIKLQMIPGADENHAAIGFLDITDEIEEQRERLHSIEESQELFESIASEYNIAYKVNLADDSFTLLRMDDDIVGRGVNFKCFTEAKEFFLEGPLHPTERQRMRKELDYDTIRLKLRDLTSYSVEYKAIINGATVWHEMMISYVNSDVVAIGFAVKDLEIVLRRLGDKRYDEYVGLYVADLDTCKIKPMKKASSYGIAQDGEAIGYELAFKTLAATHEGETKEFFERISDIEFVKNDFATDDKRSFSYKSPKLDDGKWINVESNVIERHEDGSPAMITFEFSVVDSLATSDKELMDRLHEDMQMIGGLAGEYYALYYFNIDEGFFKIYALDGKKLPKAASIVGKGGNPVDVFHKFAESDLVHPEDRYLFSELSIQMLRERLSHSKKFTVRFRRNFNGEYLWSEMDVVKYENADERANAIAVGFANRDEEIRREMKQQEQALASERERAQEEKVYQRAILNNAYSYFRINLSRNLIIPPIIEKIEGQPIDYTNKFPDPLPSYDDVIALGAKLYVDENYKESYRANQNCNYLIKCFNEGNMMPEYVCRIFSTKIGWHYRKYVTYLSKDEITGDIVGMSVAYDVTEEFKAKELENQYKAKLEEARISAEAANKSKTDFLFNMSHDIRTPMNAITGFTKMAVKHIDDKATVLDCLDKTQKAGNMLLSLINSILEVSRIESGNATLDDQPGDIYKCFSNIENTMMEIAQSKDIDLSFEFGRITNRYVYVDSSRCIRVLLNVISNAIKYTKEGGFVKVRCEQLGEAEDGFSTFQYIVSDNGIGMSEEFQKHVFEQFARENTATVSGVQGTGLGLAVVKSFVDLMGGTISVKSKQGEGTTFTIVIPMRNQEMSTDDQVSEDADSPASMDSLAEETRLEGKRVLLVEDNEMNREIAIDILEEAGMEVDTAEDGSVAVSRVTEKGIDYFDFILMDIQMPIMNGYEATSEIRKLPHGDRVPIIALSANAFKEDVDKSLAAGMDGHVAKPIDVNTLISTIKKLVG